MLTPEEVNEAEVVYNAAILHALCAVGGNEEVRADAARLLADAMGYMRRLIASVRELQAAEGNK